MQGPSWICVRELGLREWHWVSPTLEPMCPLFCLGVRNTGTPRVRNFQKHRIISRPFMRLQLLLAKVLLLPFSIVAFGFCQILVML